VSVSRATSSDTLDPETRARELALGNAEVQRELLAAHLGVPAEKIKPCVALLGRVKEHSRGNYCYVLAVECFRAGASEEVIRGHLGFYVGSQCEQPPIASHPFTHREADDTLKSLLAEAKRTRIRGHGCLNLASPLREFCLFRDNHRACPYVRGLMKQPKREGMSTILGALNLLASHKPPADWRERERMRRALLLWTIAALEQAKGYGGAELITTERELELYFPFPIARRTVRDDLAAMAEAKQIRWVPGQSRRGRAGLPPVGMKITRLFPPDRERVRQVLEAFPGSVEVGE
jgi:hypothetical protein